MSMMVSFVLSFFPRDVLDEILNLIESVSEDFPSYSLYGHGDFELAAEANCLKLSLSAWQQKNENEKSLLYQKFSVLALENPPVPPSHLQTANLFCQ